jgi:hypothetical protein
MGAVGISVEGPAVGARLDVGHRLHRLHRLHGLAVAGAWSHAMGGHVPLHRPRQSLLPHVP